MKKLVEAFATITNSIWMLEEMDANYDRFTRADSRYRMLLLAVENCMMKRTNCRVKT
jgi:hypothetical protein